MRVRSCIRCSLPLEERSHTIDGRTFRGWVRVCHCEGVTGPGWYWRNADDPIEAPAAVAGAVQAAPVTFDPDDDISDAALDWSNPVTKQAPDIFDTPHPLTERKPA